MNIQYHLHEAYSNCALKDWNQRSEESLKASLHIIIVIHE